MESRTRTRTHTRTALRTPRTRMRRYIETSLGGKNGGVVQGAVPWIEMAKSIPLWAIITAHTCNNWAFYTLLTCLPAFFNDVLDYDIKKAGFAEALPYVSLYVVAIGAGFGADRIREKGVSTGTTRRLFVVAAFGICAVFLVLTSFVKDSHYGVAYLVLAQAGLGLGFGGFNANHLDIGPRCVLGNTRVALGQH